MATAKKRYESSDSAAQTNYQYLKKIEAWNRKYKYSGRKTYTLEEAVAFMLDAHPAIPLSDARKDVAKKLLKQLENSVERMEQYKGEYCSLSHEPARVMVSKKGEQFLSFSKAAYFVWAQAYQPEIASLSKWFALTVNISDSYSVSCIFDLAESNFTPLKYGSKAWKEWKDRDGYSPEELAYLACGITPIEDGKYIDRQRYEEIIKPRVAAIEREIVKTADIPFGADDDYIDAYDLYAELCGVKEVGPSPAIGDPYFGRESLKRYCKNKGYRYIFEERDAPEDEQSALGGNGPWWANLYFWDEDELDEPSEVEETENAISDEPVCDEGDDAVSAERVCAENVGVDPGSVEVCPGVTAKDIQEMIKDAPQLECVLSVMAQWVKIEEGAKKDRKRLELMFKNFVKRHRTTFVMNGKDKECLSIPQRKGLDALFLPVGKAGPGNKKPYEEWPE